MRSSAKEPAWQNCHSPRAETLDHFHARGSQLDRVLTCVDSMTAPAAQVATLKRGYLSHTNDAEHIMGMPAANADWTVEMLDALPDDLQRYEIIDGDLFVTPAPSQLHQLVAGALFSVLRTYLKRSNVGRAMISPADVRRGDRARNRVQPDVFAVRVRDGQWPEYPYDLHDLMLAIEVASPGNPLLDYQIKRELYLSNGVPEYWIVDTDARIVSRWRSVNDPGEVFTQRIEWRPEGMTQTLAIELPAFFDDALS
jgi:Uma2 family endonuclease